MTIFEAWLYEHFRTWAKHALSLIRDTRSGGLNDARFGHRFTGHGPSDLLLRWFVRAARQWETPDAGAEGLDCSQFAVPGEKAGKPETQLSLF